jgi:phytoene dehydrogenase-like protein
MRHYDQIVVGSGISGLTATLLLALQGKRVLLLEKAAGIGGSMSRFRRGQVPFDTGFHFTGGFCEDGHGMLDDMLKVLGIRDEIHPVFLAENQCHRVAFPSLGEVHEVPRGVNRYREKLKADFPSERAGIDGFFDKLLHVCEQTSSMDVSRLGETPPVLDEDFTTLQEVLDSLIHDKVLQALLSVFCICHGSKPSEISFANHCRVAFGLYEATARVKDGGDAFVRALQRAFDRLAVDVRCRTTLKSLAEITDDRARRFVLSDGEEVAADTCILTIHPSEILALLPADHVTPAFRARVRGFEPSIGIFGLFGTLADGTDGIHDNKAIFSIFPDTDVNRMMTPSCTGPLPVVLIQSREQTNDGRAVHTITALEVSFFEQLAQWQHTATGRRGPAYEAYKAERARDIQTRIEEYFPTFGKDFTPLATASMLTFRDYLNAPFGAAYGIRQKVGQFNLISKLPVLNLYAAGQSALLPGVVGSMMSAFFVCRGVVGRQPFQSFIEERLSR